ncbi:protein-glutamine glutaminase family protein, partial [Amycolatopsis lurida]|uniref:protein-glutamine glutaminase family protein n=2 Tax=Amycolatopsis lurida TaxID=31959 RepID=UPI0011AEFDAB
MSLEPAHAVESRIPDKAGRPQAKPGENTGSRDAADPQAAAVAAQLALSRPDVQSGPAHDGRPAGSGAGPVAVAEWNAVRESVPPTRHRGERLDGNGIAQTRFDVRRGEVGEGQWVRELSVPVDLVSASGKVDAKTRREVARNVQRTLDERVNGRHRFPNGDQLHVVLDAGTPNGPRPGWQQDASRRVPVEVVAERGRIGQLTWPLGNTDAVVGSLLKFVGVDGAARKTVPGRPGSGPGGRLGDADIAAIDKTIRDTPTEAPDSRPQEEPKPPAVVAGPSGEVTWPQRLPGLGTSWSRGADGWYRAEGPGVLERAGAEPVAVPPGARAVVDVRGDLRHVVLETGVSFERGLEGSWSPPRAQAGDVRARKTDVRQELARTDGSLLAELPPESEVVVDRHGGGEKVVAYRQLKDEQGKWLPKPRVFVPEDGGGWVEHATDAVAYEAWLASANKAHDASLTLWDIAARSGSDIPEEFRLTALSDAKLKDLYSRGPEADAFAAVFELIRRKKGIALRWTQVSAVHAFGKGQVVNMAAGEGKSWLFFAHAAVNAMRPGVDGVQVTTTRGNLADRELAHYKEMLGALGVDVHRLDPDKPPPTPQAGRPTVYLGTAEDVGFTYLRHETLPGQQSKKDPMVLSVSIDEIDEALVYSNSQYILSEGVQSAAAPEVSAQVGWAHDLVRDGMDSGWLQEADFGRRPGQAGGAARLTESGREKVELLLGRSLSDEEVSRVNMAAAARWEYRENVHYVEHEGKIYIIDQTTHNVLFNPETSSESRWNGGLAQAVEFKHGLQIRSDSASSKSVTAHELLSMKEYGQKTGASGTANGHGAKFAEKGMSAEVEDMPRYYESRLRKSADVVAADRDAKLAQIAQDVQAMQAPGGSQQPQLILATANDEVRQLSDMFAEMGVAHEAIDAKWQVQQGKNFDEEFKRVIDAAGAPGKVLVINMQGARGVDISTTKEAKERGDLFVRITAHSEISADIDVQAENRAARSGGGGEVAYYSSPEDQIYRLSDNPDVQLAVIKYTNAVEADDAKALATAEQDLRDLVKPLQPNSGHPTVDTTTAQPHAPPAGPAPATRAPGEEDRTRPPDRPAPTGQSTEQPAVEGQDSRFGGEASGRPAMGLTYDEAVADVLEAADEEFAGQLIGWQQGGPGLTLPDSVVQQLHGEFVAARHAEFDVLMAALRAGTGTGYEVDEAWLKWLDHLTAATAGLYDTFTQTAEAHGSGASSAEPAQGPVAPQSEPPSEHSTPPAEAPGAVAGKTDVPAFPSAPAEAREWLNEEAARASKRLGKLPQDRVEKLLAQAASIVSGFHRIPLMQATAQDRERRSVIDAVESVVAHRLAMGQGVEARELAKGLAGPLGTRRAYGLPGGAPSWAKQDRSESGDERSEGAAGPSGTSPAGQGAVFPDARSEPSATEEKRAASGGVAEQRPESLGSRKRGAPDVADDGGGKRQRVEGGGSGSPAEVGGDADVVVREDHKRYVARLNEVLAGEPRVDFRAVLDIVRQAAPGRDSSALRAAFKQVDGVDLAAVVYLAGKSERLDAVQAHRLLERLGLISASELLPTEEQLPTPRVYTDVPAMPHDQEPVRAFAAELKTWVDSGLESVAVDLFARLDRNMRTVWAVREAYRRLTAGSDTPGRELLIDLATALPAEREFIEHLFGLPAPEVTAWQDNAVPAVVEWETALEWMRALRNLTMDFKYGDIPVPHDYGDDGCYTRGHLAALKLIQLGAHPRKIFVASGTGLRVETTEPDGSPRELAWNYHTAPLVYVRGPNGPEWMVFDSSLSERPLRQVEWFTQMGISLAVESVIEGPQQYVRSAMDHLRGEEILWADSGYMIAPYAVVTDLHVHSDIVRKEPGPLLSYLEDLDEIHMNSVEFNLVYYSGIVGQRKLSAQVQELVRNRKQELQADGPLSGHDEDAVYEMVSGALSGNLGLLESQPRLAAYLRDILPRRYSELEAANSLQGLADMLSEFDQSPGPQADGVTVTKSAYEAAVEALTGFGGDDAITRDWVEAGSSTGSHPAGPAPKASEGEDDPDWRPRELVGDGVVLAGDGAIADADGTSTGQLLPGVAESLPADIVRQWQQARSALAASKLPAHVADALAVRAGQLLSDVYQTQTFIAPVSAAQRGLISRDGVFRTIVTARRTTDYENGLDLPAAEQRVVDLARALAGRVEAPRTRGARGARSEAGGSSDGGAAAGAGRGSSRWKASGEPEGDVLDEPDALVLDGGGPALEGLAAAGRGLASPGGTREGDAVPAESPDSGAVYFEPEQPVLGGGQERFDADAVMASLGLSSAIGADGFSGVSSFEVDVSGFGAMDPFFGGEGFEFGSGLGDVGFDVPDFAGWGDGGFGVAEFGGVSPVRRGEMEMAMGRGRE